MESNSILLSPKIEEVRKILREKIHIDRETSEEMSAYVRRQEALVDSMLNMYKLYDDGIPFRPTLGNEMQVMYMRERQTLSFLLFPELLKLEYEVARVIGDVFIAPMLMGKTLPEILRSNQPIAARHGYAREEIVVAGGLRHLPPLRVRGLLRPAQHRHEDLRLRGGHRGRLLCPAPGAAGRGRGDQVLRQRRSLLRV